MHKQRSMKLAALAAALLMAFAMVFAGCKQDDAPKGIPEDATFTSIVFDVDAPSVYTAGDNLNRADTKLTANYEKGETKYTKPLTLSDVTATIAFGDGAAATLTDPYTFAEVGDYTLNVSYTDKETTKTANLTITVGEYDITVSAFGLPESYANFINTYPEGYAEYRDGVDKLMTAPGEYIVGNDNAFEFLPKATGFEEGSGEKTLGAVRTQVKMSIKEDADYRELGDGEVATYVDIDNVRNYYRFTDEAEGKSFRADVTLDPNYPSDLDDNDKTITAYFKVESGYNVYDEFGLSVLDNLNVNMWKDIKNRTLPWDDKPLSGYTDVERVILHKDITVNPDNLPDYYFWDKDRKVSYDGVTNDDQGYSTVENALTSGGETKEHRWEGKTYAELLDGSLRDYNRPDNGNSLFWYPGDPNNGEYREACNNTGNPQKGIYNSLGVGISGNGMTIGYTTEGTKHKLYSVYNHDDAGSGSPKASVIGHWSLISYYNDSVFTSAAGAYKTDDPVIENVRFIGNMQRLATDAGQPAQIATVHSRRSPTLENCVISKMYIAVICELDDGETSTTAANTNSTVHHSKLRDIYSNALYTWRGNITIEDSVIKEVGGPIAILCDGDRLTGVNAPIPQLFLKGNNDLLANASGQEPWYQSINGASGAFTLISGQIAAACTGYLGKNIVVGTAQDTKSMLNVIALLIPSTGSVFKNFNGDGETVPNTQGKVIMKGADADDADLTYDLDIRNQQLSAFPTAHSQGAPIFVYKGLSAFFTTGPVQGCYDATNGASDKNAWQAVDFDKLLLIVKGTQGEGAATYPSFGVFLGGITNVAA